MVIKKTIQKSWVKSTCVKEPIVEGIEAEEAKRAIQEAEDIYFGEIQAQQLELQAQINTLPPPTNSEERISLSEYIDPSTEAIVDDDEDIFATVIENYTIEEEGDKSEDENNIEEEKVSNKEVEELIERLKLWSIQQEETENSSLI